MEEDLNEKLAEALATNVELHGGDAMRALQVSQMTDEQKAQSRRNVDASVERLPRLAGMTGSRGFEKALRPQRAVSPRAGTLFRIVADRLCG